MTDEPIGILGKGKPMKPKDQKEIKFLYDPELTKAELDAQIKKEIEKFESEGYRIIEQEPVQIFLTVQVGVKWTIQKG